MLGKLIKYDFKWMMKQLMPFYILTVVFAIAVRILSGLESTVALEIFKGIATGTMYSLMVASIINMAIRNWVRFRISIFGDEAYLTHTLPVKKSDIFLSKFVLALVSSLITCIVVFGGILIAYYSKANLDTVMAFLDEFSSIVGVNATFFCVMIVVLFYLEILNMIVCGFVGVVIGHRFNNGKIGFSVLFGFVVYSASQAIVLIGLVVVGLVNPDFMEIFRTNTLTDFSVMNDMFIASMITYLMCIVVENIVGVSLLNKGVNVD